MQVEYDSFNDGPINKGDIKPGDIRIWYDGGWRITAIYNRDGSFTYTAEQGMLIIETHGEDRDAFAKLMDMMQESFYS